MKTGLLFVCLLIAGCAGKPPKPTVAFLYKGMSKELMLNIMGEPLQIVTTYQGDPSPSTEARQYQFSNSKCNGGSKVVCTVSVTKDGVVYGWQGVKRSYTEDGQR